MMDSRADRSIGCVCVVCGGKKKKGFVCFCWIRRKRKTAGTAVLH